MCIPPLRTLQIIHIIRIRNTHARRLLSKKCVGVDPIGVTGVFLVLIDVIILLEQEKSEHVKRTEIV